MKTDWTSSLYILSALACVTKKTGQKDTRTGAACLAPSVQTYLDGEKLCNLTWMNPGLKWWFEWGKIYDEQCKLPRCIGSLHPKGLVCIFCLTLTFSLFIQFIKMFFVCQGKSLERMSEKTWGFASISTTSRSAFFPIQFHQVQIKDPAMAGK